jgi:hypothetical protein
LEVVLTVVVVRKEEHCQEEHCQEEGNDISTPKNQSSRSKSSLTIKINPPGSIPINNCRKFVSWAAVNLNIIIAVAEDPTMMITFFTLTVKKDEESSGNNFKKVV